MADNRDNDQLPADVVNNFAPIARPVEVNERDILMDENPHYHISCFDEYCRNFKYHGVNEEALKMRLFPRILKDKAREWLDSLPPRNITTWTDLIQKFTLKYFPLAKVNRPEV
ncbi:Retrotrans gag domain-containing protein [Abeliophyllum distichum]|uniref:Retrotrans gag domain-containing protein n=1 Tax=Abeliophyllum distichum TaxID=126358 RepID=A0ABD1PBV5_9LAMI